MRTGSRRHRISNVFQVPGRRADSLRIGRYTSFPDTTPSTTPSSEMERSRCRRTSRRGSPQRAGGARSPRQYWPIRRQGARPGRSSTSSASSRRERASRDTSKRAALLRRCALPQAKTFDGYKRGRVSLPEGLGREDLPSLSFMEGHEDLVPMGDAVTGKTHMVEALRAPASQSVRSARFFTASSLVIRLRRALTTAGSTARWRSSAEPSCASSTS